MPNPTHESNDKYAYKRIIRSRQDEIDSATPIPNYDVWVDDYKEKDDEEGNSWDELNKAQDAVRKELHHVVEESKDGCVPVLVLFLVMLSALYTIQFT